MKSNIENFLQLVQEIDYQKDYTYEQRIDIFNKYQISSSVKYINPVMLLSTFLLSQGRDFSNARFPGMSHSGNVQTSFNKKIKENKSEYVTVKEYHNFHIYRIFHYSYDIRQMTEKVLFRVSEDSVTFKLLSMNFFPKQNFCFYKAANEFCKDLGFDDVIFYEKN